MECWDWQWNVTKSIVRLLLPGKMSPVLASREVGQIPVLCSGPDGRVQHAPVHLERIQSHRRQGKHITLGSVAQSWRMEIKMEDSFQVLILLLGAQHWSYCQKSWQPRTDRSSKLIWLARSGDFEPCQSQCESANGSQWIDQFIVYCVGIVCQPQDVGSVTTICLYSAVGLAC